MYNKVTHLFEVRDKGSSSGTYFKVKEKVELRQNSLIECGFLLFEINKLYEQDNKKVADICIIDSYKGDLQRKVY